MKNAIQKIYSRTIAVIALTLLILPSADVHAVYPEPGNIYYGIARGINGAALTSQDNAMVIMRLSPTNEVARYAIVDVPSDYPNYILRPALDDGTGTRYSPSATVAGDKIHIIININGTEYPVIQNIPLIGPRANIQKVDINVLDDSDGNGLSDSWERKYFGHIGVDPNADPDHDGFSNLAEYLAGTNPLDPNSKPGENRPLLAITEVTENSISLGWTEDSTKQYTLEWSSTVNGVFTSIPAERLSGSRSNVVNTTGQNTFFILLKVQPR